MNWVCFLRGMTRTDYGERHVQALHSSDPTR